MPQRFVNPVRACTIGRVGFLQCLYAFDVLPGDRTAINFVGNFTLAKLRRRLAYDISVRVTAWYVKDRHIWGEAYLDMLRRGETNVGNSHDMPSFTPSTGTGAFYNFGNGRLFGSTSPNGNIALNARYPVGMSEIWLDGFRASTWPLSQHTPANGVELEQQDWTYFHNEERNEGKVFYPRRNLNTESSADFGYPCARELAAVNAMYGDAFAASSDAADLPDSGLTLYGIEQIRQGFKSETRREIDAQYTDDIHAEDYGTSLGPDAVQRPELFWMEDFRIPQSNMPLLDQAGRGETATLSQGQININIRRKFFPESGMVFICLVPRWPTLIENEVAQHSKDATPGFLSLIPREDWFEVQPPETHNPRDYVDNTQSSMLPSSLGKVPRGNRFRVRHNAIHSNYDNLHGYPFLPLSKIGSSSGENLALVYCQRDDYREVFLTDSQYNWQFETQGQLDEIRPVGGVRASVFAGGSAK